jgi:hypothetical protein
MTEVLPIDVDLEFTVTRLAKIANTSHLSVYWGTLVRLGEDQAASKYLYAGLAEAGIDHTDFRIVEALLNKDLYR